LRITGFDRALLQLKTMTVELAVAVQDLLNKSIDSIENLGSHENWRFTDHAIEEKKSQMINRIYEMMSLRQLSDQDVQWLMNYQRIAHELERISGYACDLAEISDYLPTRSWPAAIRAMMQALTAMLADVVAVIKEDQEAVHDMAERDDQLDQALIRMLRSSRGDDDPALRNDQYAGSDDMALSLVLAFTMERAGDHVVNIAEALVRLEGSSLG
jgi:phosphate transport system protein